MIMSRSEEKNNIYIHIQFTDIFVIFFFSTGQKSHVNISVLRAYAYIFR